MDRSQKLKCHTGMKRDLDIKDRRILELASNGASYAQIASQIGYKSRGSVKNRASKIARGLGADNITQAVAMALRRGIIK